MGEVAYAVLRRQLAVVRDKEPGTRLGEDPEDLHDMRVATRRMRAALSLFAEVLPVRAQVFREELGWLGRLLGAVRDLDVQLESLSETASATAGWSAGMRPEDHDPLAELAALLERERDTARADMLAGLDSVRWERLAKGLAAMVQQGPARRSLVTRVPAVIGLPDLVVARHDAVAKAGKRAKRSGVVPDFHRLRIRCKRLRYALEFGADVYGGRTGRFVRQLTVLQDELGQMQDAEVASIRLAELATGEAHLPPATVFVMGGMAERYRREVERLVRRMPKEVSRVGGREWRDLLELMERRRAEAEAERPVPRRTLRAVPPPSDDQVAGEPSPQPERAGQAEHPASSAAPRPPEPWLGAPPPTTTAPPGGGAAPPGLSALPPPSSGERE
jgi:CHAD domain-containing protein